MKSVIYRFREFRIMPNSRPEAEPWTFAMECTECGKSSDQQTGHAPSLGWVTEHLKTNPDHLDYRERITRPYRAVPGAWQ
ncbi:hypothetical protein [Streptomyces sp. NPDC093097]|uniref:DUF7848 domain-containing protein n=1 Tax=Streptomyces sp. NPDC093097 TaxID=3366027 RepID=UPI003822EE36